MNDIIFEKFDFTKDLYAQRDLFKECFPETIGTPITSDEHYLWKFQSFPGITNKKSVEYVAKLNNDLIGYYAAIPYEYIINGNNKQVAMVCDVMTGIKARGKGVFYRLGDYSTNQFCKEGFVFSTGYPIRPEVIPGHKKVGWSFPFKIPMYGKFLKFNSFLKSRNKKFLIPLANLSLNVFNRITNIYVKSNKNIIVERYNDSQLDNIAGLNDFLSKWSIETPISLNKTVNFLKWRLGAPGKDYEIIVIRNLTNKEIVGYSIARKIFKEGVPCLGVMDFSFLNTTRKYSNQLLKEIEKSAKKINCELILMMMLKHKADKYQIKTNGFMKTPHPFSFIIKQYDYSLSTSFLHDVNNWDLMWVDSDDL